jgi:uncharacterized protein YjiS (DUF1127 family)
MTTTLFAALARRFADWRARQRAYEELSSLDDRSLADIGITRSDIPFLLSQPAGQSSGSAQVTAHSAVHRTA